VRLWYYNNRKRDFCLVR